MIGKASLAEDVIKEWQEQLDAVTRGRKKEKAREMLERKWDGFFTHTQTNKLPKDLETSSVISYGSNATDTTTQRPPVTRHGADSQRSTGQHPGFQWQARGPQPFPEHHRVILNDVQGT